MTRPSRPPLVELRRVRLTLAGRPALRGVDWTVRRGEGWLVTGANGAGKTSLLRVLAGRAWPDPGPRGGVRLYHFAGTPARSPLGLAGRLVWLSPEGHRRFARLEPSPRAGEVVLAGFAGTLLLTEPPPVAARQGARRLAAALGLAPFWHRPFAELSQGQQRLVLLARALAPRPELLVLDEFSDSLDRRARDRAAAAIRGRLRAGAAVVVATHRAEDALPGLTHRLHLDDGRAVAPPPLRPATAPRVSGRRPPRPAAAGATPLLYMRNVSVAVGDHARVRRILHRVNWTVRPGEHWAVLGPNGSGKSTLLRTVYGELSPARGGVLHRFGGDARVLPVPAARRRMGYISPALQHAFAAEDSVLNVVASGFQSSFGLLRPAERAELAASRQVLRTLGAARLAARRWGALSFGEARLALLARALAPRPQLLLLDEACDGLAPAARARFLGAVDAAARAGAHLVAAAHRAGDLPACVNRVLRLDRGRRV